MKYISKRFLSDDHDETGSIVVRVVVPEMNSWSAKNESVEASVEVRDCYNKPLTLEFGLNDDHSLKNRLDKLDLIIEELTAMKQQLRLARKDSTAAAQAWLDANPDKGDDE